MKCDRCETEATIHELTIKNGQKVERHLCERCALELGMEVQPNLKVGELLQKLVTGQAAAPAAKAAPGQREGQRCASCGTSFAEFRQSGLMGCADCYRAFEAKLGPLLERAHEGASHHVGKVPRRALAASRSAASEGESLLGGERERTQQTALLRRQLDEAVASEQYERAAKIRDDLRRLGEVETGPGAKSPEGTA
jgi:protein arginine kinase activator